MAKRLTTSEQTSAITGVMLDPARLTNQHRFGVRNWRRNRPASKVERDGAEHPAHSAALHSRLHPALLFPQHSKSGT